MAPSAREARRTRDLGRTGDVWLKGMGMAVALKIGEASHGLYFRFPWNVKGIH